MSEEERRSKFRQALDDAADKIGIRTIWSDALEQHKALEEAERRGEERGFKAGKATVETYQQKGGYSSNHHTHQKYWTISDWRNSEEYKKGGG